MKERAHRLWIGGAMVGSALACAAACGGSDDSSPANGSPPTPSPDHAGQSCASATDCYPGIDAGSLAGEPMCLDRVSGGYCTHLCSTDEDCCAVPGECTTTLKQVCSPFESTGQRMCFLSCEQDDIRAAGDAGFAPDGAAYDDTTYCTTYASTAFNCRSSGGGSQNRKVCTP